jgi:hypothetical protein
MMASIPVSGSTQRWPVIMPDAEDALKNLRLDAWYKVVAVTGGLGLIAALGARFVPGALIALGLLSVGSGEWASRRVVSRPVGATFDFPAGIVSQTIRVWRPLGIVLNISGVVLLAAGLYRLLAS